MYGYDIPVPWMLRDMIFYKSILYIYDWLDKTKVSWLLSTSHIMYFAMQHTAYSNPFVSVALFWPPNSIDSEIRFHGCQGVWVMCAFVLQNIGKSTKAFPQPHERFVKKRIVWQRCQPLILGLPISVNLSQGLNLLCFMTMIAMHWQKLCTMHVILKIYLKRIDWYQHLHICRIKLL